MARLRMVGSHESDQQVADSPERKETLGNSKVVVRVCSLVKLWMTGSQKVGRRQRTADRRREQVPTWGTYLAWRGRRWRAACR